MNKIILLGIAFIGPALFAGPHPNGPLSRSDEYNTQVHPTGLQPPYASKELSYPSPRYFRRRSVQSHNLSEGPDQKQANPDDPSLNFFRRRSVQSDNLPKWLAQDKRPPKYLPTKAKIISPPPLLGGGTKITGYSRDIQTCLNKILALETPKEIMKAIGSARNGKSSQQYAARIAREYLSERPKKKS
jgi:hypothetical protein